MNNLQKIIGTIVALSALISLAFGVNAYFAKAEELKELKLYTVQVEKRLDQKIIQDKSFYLEEQLYKIEDLYRDKVKTPDVIDRERRLKKELQDAERQLENLNLNRKQ